MRRKLTAFLALSCLGCLLNAQQITSSQVSTFKNSLHSARQDADHIDRLLRLGEYYINRPGEKKVDIDSAFYFLDMARQSNVVLKSRGMQGRIFLLLSQLYRESQKKDLGRQYVEKAIAVFENGRFPSLLGDAYIELNQYYYVHDLIDIKFKIAAVKNAVSAYHAAGNLQREAYALQLQGDLLCNSKNSEEAIQVLKMSLELYRRSGRMDVQGVYDLIGTSYHDMGNYREALRYGLMALNTADKLHDDTSGLTSTIYNRIAITLYSLKEYTKALGYFKRSFAIGERNGDIETIFLAGTNLSSCLNAADKPLEQLRFLKYLEKKYQRPGNAVFSVMITRGFLGTYIKLKQFGMGGKYCDQLINMVTINKNNLSIGVLRNSYISISLFYTASGQYKKAVPFLQAFKKITPAYPIMNVSQSYELEWFKIDQAAKRYPSAIRHYMTYKTYQDSLYTEQNTKEIRYLEAQFESDKKSNELKLKDQHIGMLKQQQFVQTIRVAHADLIKNLTLGGIVLLFIFAGILYWLYHNKQLTNKIILSKNELLEKTLSEKNSLILEKEWLLKEVHHRVKNNLQTVVSLLESQAIYLKNDALHAIESSQHRIYAMSLIHQKLYQSEDIKTLEMKSYLAEFLSYLAESFDSRGKIFFVVNIEPIELGIAQAIPLALIINEAVTNSIKHAFPGMTAGTISVSMSRIGNDITVVLADNGIGIGDVTNINDGASLGIQLMQGLCGDLEATITFENLSGTKIILTFALESIFETAGFI